MLTSQRVTDVVLKAFQAAAASQGCMNNLTWGDEGMGCGGDEGMGCGGGEGMGCGEMRAWGAMMVDGGR